MKGVSDGRGPKGKAGGRAFGQEEKKQKRTAGKRNGKEEISGRQTREKRENGGRDKTGRDFGSLKRDQKERSFRRG